ncbi:conjugal transfer protein [Streptosporangium lutulentum]
MDLPTYTNIWRIEKRLYKLYDLRLPMPLPIVWIGGFVGVLAPWSLLLYLVGLPFAAPWHVVYLVPPGIVTWLSTRPVIESKRLTELLQSQMRYVGEPRTWCRMAPAHEPSEITLTGRVWQAAPQQAASVRAKVSRKARHAQSKWAAVASARQVRPAVAAAAAAATAAPVTGERIAWGTVARPRKGTAPALGQAVAPERSPLVVPVGSALSASPLTPASPPPVTVVPPSASVPGAPAGRGSLTPAVRTPVARLKAPADPAPAEPLPRVGRLPPNPLPRVGRLPPHRPNPSLRVGRIRPPRRPRTRRSLRSAPRR